MQVFIKFVDGKTITLDVEATELIHSIKSQIQGKTGLPRKEQRLVFAGNQLEDSKTLKDYNIQKKNTIALVSLGTSIFVIKMCWVSNVVFKQLQQVMRVKGSGKTVKQQLEKHKQQLEAKQSRISKLTEIVKACRVDFGAVAQGGRQVLRLGTEGCKKGHRG